MTTQAFRQQIADLRARHGRFVLWRRPNSLFHEYMFPEQSEVRTTSDLESIGFGFLCHPFRTEGSIPSVLFEGKMEKTKLRPIPSGVHSMEADRAASTSKAKHCERITTAINAIDQGRVQKVVIAQQKELRGAVDPFELYLNACQQYSTAFIFLLSSPETGTWLGATPERLLSISAGRAVIDSLAGTQVAKHGSRSRDWTEKEKMEQQFVSDHIDSVLKALGIEPAWSQVTDLGAGELLHLHSSASFTIGLEQVPQLVRKLHPTPAVCGTPRNAAMELIRKIESQDREYYTGILGPVLHNGDLDLYVNLRCMQVFDHGIRLYAGGGITKESDPEAEWVETENKCRTMLDLLG